jgi:hypothetical protein
MFTYSYTPFRPGNLLPEANAIAKGVGPASTAIIAMNLAVNDNAADDIA